VKNIINIITINDIIGKLYLKNIVVHDKLSIICIIKNFSGVHNPLHFLLVNVKINDIARSVYKIGHTIPNTQFGGVKLDLFRFLYQLLLYILYYKNII